VSFIFAPLLAVAAVWIYTLMFAFAALWFAHFTLARLARLRESVARHTPELSPTPNPEPLP
jgi:hypothetical protein